MITKCPENIWTMKPLLQCLPKRRNTSAIPMCGEAVLLPLPLIARGTFRGSSITRPECGQAGSPGLYNICTPTSSPKPGDLVFFKGTYDTPGVSHCGIYVGDGKMLHCGDPIGYANLNTSYWQSHFLRLRAFTVTGGFEMATTKSMKIQPRLISQGQNQ